MYGLYYILFKEIFLIDFLIYFNWRLITLQYCGGFCHTFTWISHRCTCVPNPDPSSHLPPYPIPQGHPSAPALSTLLHASNLDWWSISHMIIHVSMLFSQIIPSLPSPTESKSLFFTSVSLLLSRIHGYHYHLLLLYYFLVHGCANGSVQLNHEENISLLNYISNSVKTICS